MFNLVWKRGLLLAASNVRVYDSPARFIGLAVSASNHSSRFFTSALPVNASDERHFLTKSYLMNSCGLNPEAANAAAKKITLKSPEKSDLVLTLLRQYGFTDSQITQLVTKMPHVLAVNPQQTLSPKLDFFRSTGMPPLVLLRVLSMCPSMLGSSLKKRLIPFHNYLKQLLHSEEKILRVYKRGSVYNLPNGFARVPPNASLLRKWGVSESHVTFLLVQCPPCLMTRTEKFVKYVETVVGLGIDVSKLMFVQAIQVLYSVGESGWESKKQIYRRWGWSESDILRAFSIHSICMSLSEKKIMSTMEFLVNEMHYQPKAIASCPTVLFYNLERRIMPRCRVVKALAAKGLLKKKYSLLTLVSMTDKQFVEKFIAKHRENVPQLLDLYSGNVSLVELGLNSSELAKVYFR